MVKIGDRIKIISDNPNYTKYCNRKWKVIRIYHDDKENPLYDMSVYPDMLVECSGLPFALYEYEFEIV